VRKGLKSRYTGIPDIHYGDVQHWICGDEFGVTEWTPTGMTTTGVALNVRGCDLFRRFRNTAGMK
jgi:hypothetical protein